MDCQLSVSNLDAAATRGRYRETTVPQDVAREKFRIDWEIVDTELTLVVANHHEPGSCTCIRSAGIVRLPFREQRE
jgi:hypothetical protein